jgi:hypothetical protein
MANPEKKPAQPQAEAYITIDSGGYGSLIAIPARLASVILPELRHMTTDYVDGHYVYKVTGKESEIKLIQPETMAAAILAGRLEAKP